MELKLELNNRQDTKKKKETKERVEKAKARKKDASETLQEGIERIGKMSLDEKQYAQYEAAKEGVSTGEIGRLSSGKITKGEVLSMGKTVLDKREGALKEERIRDVLDNKPSNFHVLTKDSQLPHFINRVREEVRRQSVEWAGRWDKLGVHSLTAGDYEGTGIDVFIDLSIGFSIWLPILNEGYYLAYGHVEIDELDSEYKYKESHGQITRSKAIEALTPYLGNPDHGKAFHMGSARYDLHIAINDGYEIKGAVWDTLDAMYTMTEHLPEYGLKPLTDRYGSRFLGIEKKIYTFEDLFGKRSPAPFNTQIVGIYAIYDVFYTWRLLEWQFETMKKTDDLLDCYAQIDSKLPETDVLMTRCGFNIDLEGLGELGEDFTQKIIEAKAHVMKTYDINDQFLYDMSLAINGKKIQEWKEKKHKQLDRLYTRIEKQEAVKDDCIEKDKTHLKKYDNALTTIESTNEEIKSIQEDLNNDNCDHFIKEFEFTNNNHIGYLIYDYLAIEDKTYKVKKGKKRSTAADVLEMYYEDEEALKPLATVAEYEKLLNTYVNKMPLAMEIDGRLHSEFKSGGTSTGRYSSAEYGGRPTDILDEFR